MNASKEVIEMLEDQTELLILLLTETPSSFTNYKEMALAHLKAIEGILEKIK